MKRCRHAFAKPGWRDGVWCRVCADCGKWLSLGPAKDASPEVQIEIRAAELAHHIVDILPLHMQGWNLDEEHGYRDHLGEDRGGDCRCRDATVRHISRNWHAGYLAREIISTKEPT